MIVLPQVSLADTIKGIKRKGKYMIVLPRVLLADTICLHINSKFKTSNSMVSLADTICLHINSKFKTSNSMGFSKKLWDTVNKRFFGY